MSAIHRIYERYGAIIQLVIGVVLVCSCVAIVSIALVVKHQSEQQARSAMNARSQAHIGCVRSREFAKPIGDYFARVHALDARTLRDYYHLIPKSCP